MKRELLLLLLFHALLGLVIKLINPVGFLYAIAIVIVGFYYVVRTSNKEHQVLLVCTYIISAEVFLRMTGTSIIHEYGKYLVILFCLIGAYYSGLKTNAAFFGMYLLFLLPGVIYGLQELGHEMDTRKSIIFNISGPIALGATAMYTSGKSINQYHLRNILLAGIFPLISMLMYVILYTPVAEDAFRSTESNFDTSGGFGPNQVSTMLGLGMALTGIYTLLFSKSRKEILVFSLFTVLFAYRCLLTFSRGGFYTGLCMLIFVLFISFYYGKANIKSKVLVITTSFVGLGVLLWIYTAIVTGGMLQKRYANEDSLGREKSSMLTGREILMETEMEMFFKNPFMGVGVGRVREVRMAETTIELSSHNEITRLLAEHGTLGLISLFLLLGYPMYHYLNYSPNRLLVIFFIFWLLTINHAAMRLAAPAFAYALCLLKFQIVPDED